MFDPVVQTATRQFNRKRNALHLRVFFFLSLEPPILSSLDRFLTLHSFFCSVFLPCHHCCADAKITEVHAQLLRRVSRKTIQVAVEEERAQLITAHAKGSVHDDLVRCVAAKEADRAADQEQQRRASEFSPLPSDIAAILSRVHDDLITSLDAWRDLAEQRAQLANAEQKVMLTEELTRTSNAKTADRLAEIERQRRLTSPVPEELQSMLRDLNLAVERRGCQAQALQLIEIEQQQRMTRHKMAAVSDQLERTAAQKAADAAMEVERMERIAADNLVQVQEQLTRQVHQKEANLLEDAELVRRMAERDALDPEVATALSAVNEAVARYRAVKDSIQAEEFERIRRIAEQQKSFVLGDLVSTVSSKTNSGSVKSGWAMNFVPCKKISIHRK